MFSEAVVACWVIIALVAVFVVLAQTWSHAVVFQQ
jgi:hypothetical protein